MSIKEKNILDIYIFLNIFFIFTNYIYNIQVPFIILLTLLLLLTTIKPKFKININFNEILFLNLGIVFFISAILSSDMDDAMKYSIGFFCLIINMIIFSRKNEINYQKIEKYILFFSSIHVFATIIYQIYPDIIRKLLPLFLRGSDLTRNIFEFNNNKINCGITPIQSLNAFYISCFIMIIFVNLIKNKNKKVLNICFLIIGYIALFLASKRGVLLANIVSSFYTFSYDKYKNKKLSILTILKSSLIIIIISFIGYVFISKYIPSALNIFNRFNQSDMTTGRSNIYKIVLSKFFDTNIILGAGLFSSRSILKVNIGVISDVHNIYIQLLVEMGIYGLISFLITIIIIYSKFIKVKINKYNNKLLDYALYFITLFILYGLTGNDLFDLTMSSIYFFMIAIVFSIIRKEKI
ncbi:O-antigen ligase family protein [Clostridium baratii]|uniref:Lipid A core-O-antigen ligase and related enzymes n=1 Tax=Clostridium baratii TaxID=1561 RepID=A0A174SIL6_9CLOT|nr:O-antigen ligase family protein [Clostridium baratii]CUP97533.1 Lipid A core-O-antigen ligase and related enzymes [Clostridium baratii]